MTAEQLISALRKRGVEISRRSLFAYQKVDPREAPEFDAVDDWARFIRERQVYEAGRTQSTEKREAKERREMSRNGRQQAKRNLANGDSDAEKFSLGAERKERILRLRLSNQVRRSKLEVLSRNTVTMAECEQALEGIKRRVSGELLRLPETLSHQLAHREPRHVQELLTAALRSALDRLSRPEDYFKPETEHGANGLGAVSGG
jgi:flagellar biosynthesis/type III secretory pathway protein FliH